MYFFEDCDWALNIFFLSYQQLEKQEAGEGAHVEEEDEEKEDEEENIEDEFYDDEELEDVG